MNSDKLDDAPDSDEDPEAIFANVVVPANPMAARKQAVV